MVGISRKDQTGFTLIESMIALAIFSFMIYVMMQMQYSLERTTYWGRDRSLAAYLAQDKLEELKGLPYDDPSLVSGSDTVEKISRTWTVTDNTPDTDTKTIEVVVSWGSPVKTITIQTIIGKKND
jgi:type II secretion system protein I